MKHPEMKPGTLIKIRPEWREPYERDIPYMVIEDRDDRVLVQELREYAMPGKVFLGTWCWSKDWIYPIDTDIADKAEKLANEAFNKDLYDDLAMEQKEQM